MVLRLKEGADKEEMKQLEAKLDRNMEQKKGFDAEKYKGTVNIKEDPLKAQKRLRNEWERDFS